MKILCRLLGHQLVPARSIGPMMMPECGLVHGWQKCAPADSRGSGCPRCGRYEEHTWVTIERQRLLSGL